jgi:hypothetical protein
LTGAWVGGGGWGDATTIGAEVGRGFGRGVGAAKGVLVKGACVGAGVGTLPKGGMGGSVKDEGVGAAVLGDRVGMSVRLLMGSNGGDVGGRVKGAVGVGYMVGNNVGASGDAVGLAKGDVGVGGGDGLSVGEPGPAGKRVGLGLLVLWCGAGLLVLWCGAGLFVLWCGAGLFVLRCSCGPRVGDEKIGVGRTGCMVGSDAKGGLVGCGVGRPGGTVGETTGVWVGPRAAGQSSGGAGSCTMSKTVQAIVLRSLITGYSSQLFEKATSHCIK